MTDSGALFLGLTAIVAGLMGLLAFAFAKFVSAARSVGKERAAGAETAFMAVAVEQAEDAARAHPWTRSCVLRRRSRP